MVRLVFLFLSPILVLATALVALAAEPEREETQRLTLDPFLSFETGSWLTTRLEPGYDTLRDDPRCRDGDTILDIV